jgi:hypothetical protein
MTVAIKRPFIGTSVGHNTLALNIQGAAVTSTERNSKLFFVKSAGQPAGRKPRGVPARGGGHSGGHL